MRMTRRWLLVLTLAGALLALTPLAYASPTDPAWLVGIFDEGDADDVVLSITAAVGVADSHPPEDLVGPPRVVVAPAPQADGSPAPTQALAPPHTRAPPAC